MGIKDIDKMNPKSTSTVRETFRCLKEKRKYVRDLENLLAKVTIFYSRKKQVERIMEKGLSRETSRRKRGSYLLFMSAMQNFDKKYNKFINVYQRHCKSLPRLAASSGTSEEPAIITLASFTLAKLSRRIRKLYARMWLVFEIANMIMNKNGTQLTECGEILPFYDYCIPEKKHYLFAFKGNDIGLQFYPEAYKTILVGNCVPGGPLESSGEESFGEESSGVKEVINLANQFLKELPEESEYPDASVLFLQRNKQLSFTGSSFFDNMPELSFLDLSDTRIRILPSSLFRLPKLKVLLLRNCACMPEIPTEIGNLTNLEVLDLAGTEQYLIPVQMGRLVRLRHVELSIHGTESEQGYVNLLSEGMVPEGMLSEFEELESLSITVHRNDMRWGKNAACIVKDLVNLERLSFLQFYFPRVATFQAFIRASKSWTNGSLRSFKFIVGFNASRFINIVPSEVESLFDESMNCLRFVRVDDTPEEIKNVLAHAAAFYLDTHTDVERLSEFGYSNFKPIKLCLVRDCAQLGVLFENKGTEYCFWCLEHLWVYNLSKLEYIWEPLPLASPSTPPSRGSFWSLKSLTVSGCGGLKFILLESMLCDLKSLEELVVEWCASVETIVKEDTTKKVTKKALPRLKTVELAFLGNLVTLGNGISPLKHTVKIICCQKFTIQNREPKTETRHGGGRRIPSSVKLRACMGEV